MDTEHLKAVLVVARSGSFTAAARELFMAQSTLSRQVAKLERDLGVALFRRGAWGIELTIHGEAFMRQARRVLEAADQAERAAQASASRLAGSAMR